MKKGPSKFIALKETQAVQKRPRTVPLHCDSDTSFTKQHIYHVTSCHATTNCEADLTPTLFNAKFDIVLLKTST